MKTVMTVLGALGVFAVGAAAGAFVSTAAVSACIYNERNNSDKYIYNILYDCGKSIIG